ncbi:L,D-transpeptidase family protein [Brevibacillus sp. GCM10020057]|uniref:L,D-transpeptidase family protein n=1 Tax=Brevibacillus sp. GCM10020057 TaxID=3317327 RepID=UPI0036411482
MDKVSFLQEKSTYHMKYPDQSDLSFYRWYTEQHPDEAIGWYHLGREYAERGEQEQALSALRRALHAKPGPYYNEAREAYQALLRERKQQEWRSKTRRLLATLLFLYFQFAFSPSPLTEPGPAAATTAPVSPAISKEQPHVEVIAVPAQLGADQLKDQVRQYVENRRPSLSQPYSVIVVPEVAGAPLFTPLLFYQPANVMGVLRYHPLNRTVISQTWFPRPGAYPQDSLLRPARTALGQEQQVLEHVLLLRNALYRFYQQKGSLPDSLSQLAGAYPGNYLPQVPAPPAGLGLKSYLYRPASFRPEAAWASLRDVLPLPGYPEPLVPLEPLQIRIAEATYTMRLMSGSQVVRSYPIGIGKDGLSPEGYFTILQKINHPRGHDNIYGTRGMVFESSGYAIHGTNHPESIGASLSLGCIRMLNAAVEELYSFVSLGTEVIATDAPVQTLAWSNPAPLILPARPAEETPQVVYRWLH